MKQQLISGPMITAIKERKRNIPSYIPSYDNKKLKTGKIKKLFQFCEENSRLYTQELGQLRLALLGCTLLIFN